MHKVIALALIVLSLLSRPALAQEDVWAALRALPRGTGVTLTLTDGRYVAGTLVQVRPDAVLLVNVGKTGVAELLPRATVAQYSVALSQQSLRRFAFADWPRDVAAVRQVVTTYGVGRRVKILTSSSNYRQGTIVRIDLEEFALCAGLDCRQVERIPYANLAEIGPVGRGAKIAIVVISLAILAVLVSWSVGPG